MMKCLIVATFFVFAVATASGNYYLEYNYSQPLAWGAVHGSNYLSSNTHLYRQRGEYYFPVYKYPQSINKAYLAGNVLYTEQFRLRIGESRISIDKTPYPFSSRNNVPLRVVVREPLNKILFVVDVDKQSYVVFMRDKLEVGLLANNVVKVSDVPATVKEKKVEGNSVVVLTIGSRKFTYVQINNRWIPDLLSEDLILQSEVLAALSADQLELKRLEIPARKGSVFANERIQKYFSSQRWYRPDPTFNDDKLTERERKYISRLYHLEMMKRREAIDEQRSSTPPKQ